MQTKWDSQHRGVLMRLVVDADQGVVGIDVAAYAAALRLTHQQVYESLGALSDGDLVDLRYDLDASGTAVARIVSVSAAARQIHDARPAATVPASHPRVGSVCDEVVLRATSGP